MSAIPTALQISRAMLADRNWREPLTMRWLGDNMTLTRYQWIDLLYELRPESESYRRIVGLLTGERY